MARKKKEKALLQAAERAAAQQPDDAERDEPEAAALRTDAAHPSPPVDETKAPTDATTSIVVAPQNHPAV